MLAEIRRKRAATPVDSVENTKVAGWYNGRRTIVLAVLRQPDANTVEVVDSVKSLLPRFRDRDVNAHRLLAAPPPTRPVEEPTLKRLLTLAGDKIACPTKEPPQRVKWRPVVRVCARKP